MTIRHTLGLAALFLALLCAAAAPLRAEEPPGVQEVRILRVATENHPCVAVAAVARRPDGRPAKGLQAGDFQVLEDGSPQSIRGFVELTTGNLPLAVALVLDTSTSMVDERMNAGALDDAKKAASLFLDKLRPKDRVALVTISTSAALRRGLGPVDEELRSLVLGLQGDGATDLYGSVGLALEALRSEETGAFPVVVLLTDGTHQKEVITDTLETCVQEAQKQAVPLYCVGLGREVETAALQQMAAETGGSFYNPANSSELDAIYTRISEELYSIYLLRYRSNRLALTERVADVELRCGSGSGAASDHYTILAPSPVTFLVVTVLPAGLLGLFFAWSFLRLVMRRR